MRAKNNSATAQVIALPEINKTRNLNKVNSMKNKTISIDGYRKIHRAKNVSFNMNLLIRRQEANAMPLLWIPDIFSYIADDLSDISEELKAQGLYDEFLRQERNNHDKE
ncbi:hypothetical protein HV319_18430 [Citrobacter freundii]|uniref:hypothetical protein n=1 Tax=Citrobacter freundii complex TaxID=1344959 RepID=UPI000E0434CB|nr:MULTISPECIES: hypothetical protein [Citrobacter freundii complex]EEH4703264.1 hypothetical protein [Salmonella enterica]QLR93305.1 hypothetical protein HV330_18410 [Citrobacter freundii]QLS41087.1 hypothetical protein HV319_18430 [Citrobacter freundii]STH96407.1 prophage derepression protein [Citrobacter braakii]